MNATDYNLQLDINLAKHGIVDQELFSRFCDAEVYGAASTIDWLSAKLHVLQRRLNTGHTLSVYSKALGTQTDISSNELFLFWVNEHFPSVDINNE